MWARRDLLSFFICSTGSLDARSGNDIGREWAVLTVSFTLYTHLITLLFLALAFIELFAILLLEVVGIILLWILRRLLLLLKHLCLDNFLCSLEYVEFYLAFPFVFFLLLGLNSLLEIQKLFFFRAEDVVDPVVYWSPLAHYLLISLRVKDGLAVGE